MAHTQSEKTPKAVTKSFMTAGPTLHYSHKNVQWCQFLALAVFVLGCLMWSRMVTGRFWAFEPDAVFRPSQWRLDRLVTTGTSIFEYPWQILVLGLLMGLFGIVPPLVSQLMSFRYSVPFILAVVFAAGLPGLAFFLLVSSVATACRPLRFRSRIIAILLCTTPQLFYWGFFGSAKGAGPIEWGFSFTPWICAWLSGMATAGFVLGIGHFTRYRPGLVWIFSTVTLVIAAMVFDRHVGFDELDYQLYVAKHNPEQAAAFRDHSMTEALDATIMSPQAKTHFAGFFFPTEPIPLRAELKRRIQFELAYDRWPSWFVLPAELRYSAAKERLEAQYDLFMKPPRPWWMPRFVYAEFMKSRAESPRMAVALYYKALLSEYSPDVALLDRKEVLRLRNDYPLQRSAELWHRIYRDFGRSPESIEARWRIAKHWAGAGRFEQADALAAEAQTMIRERLSRLEQLSADDDTIFKPFRAPSATAISASKLDDLRRKCAELRSLIGEENRTDEPSAQRHLAEFVMLNPYTTEYSWHLDRLIEQMGETDPLRDNVLLAKARLIEDDQGRAARLEEIHRTYPDTDGGAEALYRLGLLRIGLWREAPAEDLQRKAELLAQARRALDEFVARYPGNLYVEQVKKNLAGLPASEG